MKKKFLALLFILFMLPCALLFTGCGNGNKIRYMSVVPSDRPFYSEMTYSASNPDDNYDWTEHINVVRKSATVAGQDRDVIYVDYNRTNNLTHAETHYTCLYVQSKAFCLEGDAWVADGTGVFSNWKIAYIDGYVDHMTQPINGRDFYKKYETERTEAYIEYNFKNDNETFRISNNMYHVLLGYSMVHGTFQVNHTATLTLEVSGQVIPHLNTITAEMLAE